MDHIAYECRKECDDPHCNYCRGGLFLCVICGQAEADLEPTCPGPPTPTDKED